MHDRIDGPFHPALIADTVATLRRDRKPAISPMTITHIAAEVRSLDPLADPNRDGAEPYRMSNGQVLLPATWGNYTPKTPPVALAAATEATGEPISPRTAQYRPLAREVARAYGTRRGSDLTHPQLVMTDQAAEKSRAARRWIADRWAEGYTVEMLDPKDGQEDCNE